MISDGRNYSLVHKEH